jgi:hypothetical protein
VRLTNGPLRNLARAAIVGSDMRADRAAVPALRQLLGLLLVPVLLGACSAGNASSPTPASTPSPPSASPTPTGAATPAPTAIAYPTGATDVVLRLDQTGGFVAPAALLTEVPPFTLYGDGHAIYRPASSPTAPLRVATLSPSQMQDLLAYALGAGRLRDARTTYEATGVADAPTTVFTVHAGGVDKTVSVYALGIAAGTGADAADRTAFESLRQVLADFGGRVTAGGASDAGTYEPARYRAILADATMQGEMLDWPWSDLTPDDFTAPGGSSARVHVLTAAQAKQLVAAPQGGSGPVGVVGPDHAPYTITLVPLLPDQAS